MRVLLVPNAGNPKAVESARELAPLLATEGHEPVLADADALAADLEERAAAPGDFGPLDLVVALGGDGTILKAVHLLAGADVPVLGLNLGRLGFLAGAGDGDLAAAVHAALAGEAIEELRSMLQVSVTLGGRPGGTHQALNEVYIGRGPGGRAVDAAAAVNGTDLLRVVCDGIIISTPTGSTAYALSAGGPLMSPDVRGMLMVAANPHTLAYRPVVLGEHDVVRVTLPDASRAEACVVVDGDLLPCRAALDEVEVRLAPGHVRLLRLGARDFYSILRDTFFGA